MRSLIILMIFAAYAYFSSGCRDSSRNSEKDPVPETPREQDSEPTPQPESEASLLSRAQLEFSAMADVNGDGRSDLVHFTDVGVFVSLSNGKGFLAPKLWTRDFAWGDQDRFPRLLADVNGNGRADIVGFSRNQTVVAHSHADSFGPMTVASRSFGHSSADGNWESQDRYPRMLGYVNGDPFMDIVACRVNGCYVAYSNAVNFQEPGRDPWLTDYAARRSLSNPTKGWNSLDEFPRFLADVNGNRRSDMIAFGEAGVWVSELELGIYRNAAESKPRLRFFGQKQGWTSQTETPRLIGDFDGDGRADILGFDLDGRVHVAYGRTGLTECSELRDPDLEAFMEDYEVAGKSLTELPRFLADITGDGKAELIFLTKPKDLRNPGVYIKKF